MALGSDDRIQGALFKREEWDPGLAPQDEAARRKQRLRSLAIAWALAAMAVMFFLVTIVRLGANVANRPF